MGKYQIDKSCYLFDENNGIYSKYFKRFLKGTRNNGGYYYVSLKCTDGKIRKFYNHIVIWEHFNGEKPKGLDIGHDDGDQTNNKLSNLVLCTHSDNCNHPLTRERCINNPKISKQVYQYDLNGKLIGIYASLHEAERNGYGRKEIKKCCNGKQKTHKGSQWSRKPL